MATKNEMFELLVKITGNSDGAKKTLVELKKEAKDLDLQLNQAELGSKSFEDIKTRLSDVKRRIQDLSQPADSLIKSGKSAQYVAMNLNRVIQDMPYGIMGIANNVDVLQESWIRLRNEQGSVKGAFSAVIGAMTGPTGIMLAISLVTALVVAFGDKLVKAIMSGEQEVEKLKTKLDDVSKYSRLNFEIGVIGMSALEALEFKLRDIEARLHDVKQAAANEKIISRGPGYNDAMSSFRLFATGDASILGQMSRQTAEYTTALQAENRRMADRIKSMKSGLSAVDEKVWKDYAKALGMSAPSQAEIKEAELRHEQIKTTRERDAQVIKDKEKAEKEGVAVGKKALSAAQKAARQRDKDAKDDIKDAEEWAKLQETLYSSMVSNIEQAIQDDLITVDMALNGMRSGEIGERYNALVSYIDLVIQKTLDAKIRAELQTIRQKIAGNQALTSENVAFLQAYGGFNQTNAAFVGRVSGLNARSADEKTFKNIHVQWDKDLDQVGSKFEETAVDAFSSSVSLFSSQLAQAIFQGGMSFSQILTNVATTFGQMLMQFVIEALAQKAVGGILGVLGLAEGSMSAPAGYTWVGEKGPELVRMNGGEEVVPNNQVGRRLIDLYRAGNVATDFRSGVDMTGVINALNRQTKALLQDRLNYQITSQGEKEIARSTRRQDSRLLRYSGQPR